MSVSLYYIIGLVFGFEQQVYIFSESVGTGNLGVRLSPESGQLAQNLIFTFSTADSTAVGKPSINNTDIQYSNLIHQILHYYVYSSW